MYTYGHIHSLHLYHYLLVQWEHFLWRDQSPLSWETLPSHEQRRCLMAWGLGEQIWSFLEVGEWNREHLESNIIIGIKLVITILMLTVLLLVLAPYNCCSITKACSWQILKLLEIYNFNPTCTYMYLFKEVDHSSSFPIMNMVREPVLESLLLTELCLDHQHHRWVQ